MDENPCPAAALAHHTRIGDVPVAACALLLAAAGSSAARDPAGRKLFPATRPLVAKLG